MTLDVRIRGVSPVFAVPFLENGDIDMPGFGSVVDHVLASGVSSALMFGLASEFYKLSDAERDELAEVLLARVAGRTEFAAICSVTDHATHPAVARARRYEALGAAAINVLPPHFLAPARRAVVGHLDAVIGAVAVPVIVQYAPAETGTSLAASDLVDLASRHPNFGIVKVEAVPPGRMIAELASHGIASLVGQAGVHLPSAFDAGAIGVQPGSAMIPLYQRMWAAADSGDRELLAALHAELLPTISYWMTGLETTVQATKLVLQRLGIIGSNYCREPSAPLDSYAVELVDATVRLLRSHQA